MKINVLGIGILPIFALTKYRIGMIVQKWKKVETDEFLIAERYYSLLSAFNSLKLTQKEIQLMAFTAVRGNVSYSSHKQEFCEKYDTTPPTINNMISKLKKKGVLVKDNMKTKVNPIIALDFNKDITLEIKLLHG